MATRSSRKKGATALEDMEEDTSEVKNKRAAEDLLEKEERRVTGKKYWRRHEIGRYVADSTSVLLERKILFSRIVGLNAQEQVNMDDLMASCLTIQQGLLQQRVKHGAELEAEQNRRAEAEAKLVSQ